MDNFTVDTLLRYAMDERFCTGPGQTEENIFWLALIPLLCYAIRGTSRAN